MKRIRERELTEDLSVIIEVKEEHLGIKIKNYHPDEEKYKKVTKEGVLPLLRENLKFSQKDFLELHINKHLSLYYSTHSNQVCNFRIGCFLGRIDKCFKLKREDIVKIFNLVHYQNTSSELRKIIRYIKILKSKIKKEPYKQEYMLKDNMFFTKISSINDF